MKYSAFSIKSAKIEHTASVADKNQTDWPVTEELVADVNVHVVEADHDHPTAICRSLGSKMNIRHITVAHKLKMFTYKITYMYSVTDFENWQATKTRILKWNLI